MRDELFRYGYLWIGMQEISLDEGVTLFDHEAIYRLYEDNTESECESTEDMFRHVANGGKLGIELQDYNHYVVFVLGRDLLKDIIPYENDLAYDFCINVAKDFQISEQNAQMKGIYECLEDYIQDNFYREDNGNVSFRGHSLEETCKGVRV